MVLVHARQERVDQLDVYRLFGRKPNLAAEAAEICLPEQTVIAGERILRFLHRGVLILGEKRQKRFGILNQRYLYDGNEAPAFRHSYGQSLARADAICSLTGFADYRLEWGDKCASGRAKARRYFIKAQEAPCPGGRLGIAASCAAACTSAFLTADPPGRASSRCWRNSKGEITKSKPRTPAATESAVAQLIAVLNHAANAKPRSDTRPTYKPLPVAQVQRKRLTSIGIPELGQVRSATSASRRIVTPESRRSFRLLYLRKHLGRLT